MISKKLLTELIEELDTYSSFHPDASDLEGFIEYMYVRNKTRSDLSIRKIGGDFAQFQNREMDAENMGKLLAVLNRYAKHYIKLAFDDSLIQTPEEFTFLMVLFTHQSMLQAELIRRNVMEKASGNEIIKRLMRIGLITDAPKVDDKRAKPIAISELGRAELFKVLPKMKQVGHILGGNLTAEEKKLLLHLLSKLDHYHHDLYTDKDKSTLDDYASNQ
jgi:DNA-binding MarR family transcriptional regulator